MAAKSYHVLAPYVTAVVRDPTGSQVTLGYYRGDTINDPVGGDHLDKLLRAGYVEKAEVEKAVTKSAASAEPPAAKSKDA